MSRIDLDATLIAAQSDKDGAAAREASKLLDSDGERAPRLRFDPREPRHGGVPVAPVAPVRFG